ncbi:ATP-binding protein [Enterococcus larvae]|uniref:ATP-binding protein n=1 Tax=Enterococcus larvae TaxID=2794352 RepID=UPI003F2F22CE
MVGKNIEQEIFDLIGLKTEGAYWDFKRNWHADEARLLHDIICMANNIENRDAYIIIGVDESDDFSIVPSIACENRKNTNELTTFLRDKKFVGGVRPIVTVETSLFMYKEIDIITIKNSNHTPFMLEDDFPKGKHNQRVLSYRVYTRINDSNTPINGHADLDKVEYLWRKRFGINLTAIEKVELFLSKFNSWVYDDFSSIFYYKYEPNYTITIIDPGWDNSISNPNRKREFYNKLFTNNESYKYEQYEIKYNDLKLFEGTCSYNDGKRLLIVNPKVDAVKTNHSNHFRYHYYLKESIEHMLNQIFLSFYSKGDSEVLYSNISDVIVEFNDTSEKEAFHSFLLNNQELLATEITDSSRRKLWEQYNMDAFEAEEYFNGLRIKQLYKEFLSMR